MSYCAGATPLHVCVIAMCQGVAMYALEADETRRCVMVCVMDSLVALSAHYVLKTRIIVRSEQLVWTSLSLAILVENIGRASLANLGSSFLFRGFLIREGSLQFQDCPSKSIVFESIL